MVHTNKVFVHPNPTRANAVKALPEVLDFLLSEGFHVYMDSMYAQSLGKEYKVVSYASAEECMSAADFILVLGGDGTILHIASSAACHGKPVLGINFGTLGFLTELDISDLEMLKQIEEDRHKLDRRLLLDVRVVDQSGATTFTATALNDAAILKGDVSKTVKLAVFVNDKRVMGFAGDGAVVCTPTGSTGYSLSAGGPILEPSSTCIAVTPVCPHSLAIKSFVVSADRVIEIRPPVQDNTVQLSVDGYQIHKLTPGESVIIRQSGQTVSLIRLRGVGFYERINEKLSSERL